MIARYWHSLLFAACIAAPVDSPRADNTAHVLDQFLDAYNRHDIGTMLELVSADVQTMAVKDDRIEVLAKGREALRKMLMEGFEAVPSTRLAIAERIELGQFTSILEKAVWESRGETRHQCSLSVYRVTSGKIAAVWYFPSQDCE